MQTAWHRAGVQPHRFERYVRSDDPDFEPKATDVIGLYLQPPQHAAVFAADEKTAIQALDQLDPALPMSPGRAERHGFEYYRHGTLSLFAAPNTKTGEVLGQTVPRHTSAAFVEFLGEDHGPPSARARDSRDSRQLIDAQNTGGARVLRNSLKLPKNGPELAGYPVTQPSEHLESKAHLLGSDFELDRS